MSEIKSKTKKYRFFYHYFKQKHCMSVHFRNKCIQCQKVICNPPTESKWNKIQPQLVIQGFASDIKLVDDTIIILE